MKLFDTQMGSNDQPRGIRAPVTLQGFEMLPQGMKPAANVSSAAAGGKSHEIPPAMRLAMGMLAEVANHGAKSSAGCGCGGNCGPCGGAKASLIGGASGATGAGAVMHTPAALRSFEMLPQGMNVGAGLSSGAGGMRGYEIPPNAKLVGQGLMEAQRTLKAYELVPRSGVAVRGPKITGCGCGGKCGSCGRKSPTVQTPYPGVNFALGVPKYVSHDFSQWLSYVPPVLEGGGDPSICERINGEVSELVGVYIAFLSRHREISGRFQRCLDNSLGLSDRYSYQVEEDRLRDLQLVLQDARMAAVVAMAWDEVADIDREIDAINPARSALRRPREECDMAVAAHIRDHSVRLPGYEEECRRLAALDRQGWVDRIRFARYFRKAISNYRELARRYGCRLNNWGQDELLSGDSRWLDEETADEATLTRIEVR